MFFSFLPIYSTSSNFLSTISPSIPFLPSLPILFIPSHSFPFLPLASHSFLFLPIYSTHFTFLPLTSHSFPLLPFHSNPSNSFHPLPITCPTSYYFPTLPLSFHSFQLLPLTSPNFSFLPPTSHSFPWVLTLPLLLLIYISINKLTAIQDCSTKWIFSRPKNGANQIFEKNDLETNWIKTFWIPIKIHGIKKYKCVKMSRILHRIDVVFATFLVKSLIILSLKSSANLSNKDLKYNFSYSIYNNHFNYRYLSTSFNNY